jgi:hypothetical protein
MGHPTHTPPLKITYLRGLLASQEGHDGGEGRDQQC